MKALIKSLLLVTAILLCFTFTGCTTTATPEEPALEEPELPEAELTEEEDEPEEETTKSGSQSTTSGSGFQHTVKMEIDGVVETDKNEGWWNTD
jgi:hypothetical protein